MMLLARLCSLAALAAAIGSATAQDAAPARIRFATFNVALGRTAAGALTAELRAGDSKQAHAIAEIVQRVRPDVLVLNEFDYDAEGHALAALQKHYFAKPHGEAAAIDYPHTFLAPVNAGLAAGADIDGDGEVGGARDVFGAGAFPGQGGMAVLSRYPIDTNAVRTFQKLLWREMPEAPAGPGGRPPSELEDHYQPAAREVMRLSSKSHWDVPVTIDGRNAHFLVSNPPLPVRVGDRLRNGGRTRDEIRFWFFYAVSKNSGWIRDDAGGRGGLASGEPFVIAGTLNDDPMLMNEFGSGVNDLVMRLTDRFMVPASAGSYFANRRQGGVNARHRGRTDTDTADLEDETLGNRRLDYVLPSRDLSTGAAGVFWPPTHDPLSRLVASSEHRLVWVDVRWPSPKRHVGRLQGQQFGGRCGVHFLNPFSFSDNKLTLIRWWTNGCPFCKDSLPALEKLRQEFGERGLAVIGMYHPKPQRIVTPEEVRTHARALGFDGELAIDAGWDKLADLQMRGAPDRATSISVLVDQNGEIVWVHRGPRLHPPLANTREAADGAFEALQALLRERLQ